MDERSVGVGVRLLLGWLVVLGCLARPAVGGGPPLRFDHLSISDGLSQSIVGGIVQDQQGFVWLITEDGLNRFDGSRFTVFRNVADDPTSLSHSELTALAMDHSGALWVGTFGAGLNRFDPLTERATRFAHDPGDPGSLAADTVRVVLEDSLRRLWVGTQGGGLDRLDPGARTFVHLRHDPADPMSLSHDDVRALVEDHQGMLWIGTRGGGLDRLDPETGRIVHLRCEEGRPCDRDGLPRLEAAEVRALLEDQAGTLWIGTGGEGLGAIDAARSEVTVFRAEADRRGSLPGDVVTSLVEAHDGTLWVGTDGGGIGRLDSETGRFWTSRHHPDDPGSLATDRVLTLMEDRSRVMWAGTYGGGVDRVDPSHGRLLHVAAGPGSLDDSIVWCFAEDAAGGLWVGTDSGGLNHWDRQAGRWQSWVADPDQPGDPTRPSHSTVRALLVDRNGALWIATHGGGLSRRSPASGRFTHFRHDPDDPGSIAADQLRSLTQDRDGALWIGTFGGGLDRLVPGSDRFEHHRHDPDDPQSLSNDFVRQVVEGADGSLWVGTQGGGLNRLDPATGRFEHLRHDPDDPASLANDYVFAIHQDPTGALWVGTYGGGLDRLDPATGRFEHYTTRDGLASDAVYAILAELPVQDPAAGDGSAPELPRLWISTNRGLSRLDPASGTFRTFDVRDGLQSNELNGGAAYRSSSGEMFFGGIDGFSHFFPSQIGSNPVAPAVVITELRIFNRPVRPGELFDGRVVLQRPVWATDRLVLRHSENVFSLELAALHYAAPEKNHYAYVMHGLSETWIEVGAARRFATFTGLAPGTYRLEAQAASCDGVWSETPASLEVVITPPVVATWWFRTAVLLALAGVVAGVVRGRMRTVRLRAELDAAHDAQMAIMPHADPEVDGFDISALCCPAHEVGGDFFDHFWLSGEPRRLCLVVGDVAGKAMRAAMTAVMADGMVFSRARREGSLEEVMTDLNRSMHLKASERMFTALCAMVLEPSTREVVLVNAGLCEPLLRTAGGVEALVSPDPRLPLGAFRDTRYCSRTVRLAEGDVLIVYSDGIPEAQGRARELYGYDRLQRLVAGLELGQMTAGQVRDAVMADVRRFCRGARPSDDMTVLVIRCR